MKRGWPILLYLLLLMGCGKSEPAPVLVGQLTPTNGPDQELGEHASLGIQLAVTEANEEKVNGRPVTVIRPVNDGTADGVEAQAVRLVKFDKVAALVGGTDAAQAERLSRVAQNSAPGILVVTPSWILGEGVNSFAFSVGIAPADQGKTLAEFAFKELKLTKAAALADARQPGYSRLATAFTDEFRKLAGSAVEQWSVGADDGRPDPAGQAARLEHDIIQLAGQAAKLDLGAVLFAGKPAELRRFRSELCKARPGAKVVIFYGGEEGDPKTLLGDDEVGPDVYRVTAFALDADLPKAKAFAKKYEEQWHAPPDPAAVLAYDAARVLFEAMRLAKKYQGDKVRDELVKLQDFECLTGPLAFNEDHTPRRTIFVIRFDKGQPKLAKTYPPVAK